MELAESGFTLVREYGITPVDYVVVGFDTT